MDFQDLKQTKAMVEFNVVSELVLKYMSEIKYANWLISAAFKINQPTLLEQCMSNTLPLKSLTYLSNL